MAPATLETDIETHALWLERIRRDTRVTPIDFRLAHAIAAHSVRRTISATATGFAAMSATTAQTASAALYRLTALGYLSHRRQGSGAPISVSMIVRPQSRLTV